MIILLVFAFLAGIVTILSPCILPILPVILATSLTGSGSRTRPYGIVVGFILSFTCFTLFLSTLVRLFGIPVDILRNISVIVIALFGISLLISRFQVLIETLFSQLSGLVPTTTSKTGLPAQTGFGGGVAIGLSLGLLWTPCVGPILASVISLAITGTVSSDAFFITLAYSLGTAIPMYLIIISGRGLFAKVPWLLSNTATIQKVFGIIMILTAIAIYSGLDRSFQSYIISRFPQYGSGLTKIEDNSLVRTQLQDVGKPTVSLTKKGTPAPELIPGGEWFNSIPLSLADLKGKVVLLDVWTYTCINCQRTLPYIKNWYDKYRDQGLVVIGIHAPEFEFEKEPGNVAKAISDFGIKYPVMQDNDFATWRAYHNNYWPAKYLIDKDGNVRYTHFGEGDYDQTESAIQDLLKETGATVSEDISNIQVATYARTPETYLGTKRGEIVSYLSYEGKWTPSAEYNQPSDGSKLNLQFNAKSVYLVLKNDGSPAAVKVYLDGVYLKDIVVDGDKLYTLVDLDSPGSHKLQLQFVDTHAELFAFTFG